MTFEEFKPIFLESYPEVKEDMSIPEVYDLMGDLYKTFELQDKEFDEAVLLANGDADTGLVNVRLLWINPKFRRQGYATEALQSLGFPHFIIVGNNNPLGDLLLKEGYEVSTTSPKFLGDQLDLNPKFALCYTKDPTQRKDIYEE